MVKRNNKKIVQFNSPELASKMLERAYKEDARWFDFVAESERENFALKYGTKLWNVSPTGNSAAIVISYPRPNGLVKIFDLDCGETFWVKLSKLTTTRVSGRNTERNYEWSGVCGDDLRCESEDMEMLIDWGAIEEKFTKKK
jgi:hypothetical protein